MENTEKEYDILEAYDVKDIWQYSSHPFDGDYLTYENSEGEKKSLAGRTASTIYREFKKKKLIEKYGSWEEIPDEKKTIFLFI